MNNTSKWSAGHLLIGISIAASVVSASLNIWHSLPIALWSIPIILLSEGTRALLPFAAVKRGWTKQLKIIFGAVVALCLLTSTAFLADKFADVLRSRSHQTQVLAQKAETVKALQTKINEIKENASVASLLDLAKSEEKNGGCLNRCLAFKKRIPDAERREALETELKALTRETQAAPVKVNGLGWLLGSMTGLDEQTGSALSMIAIAAVILYTLDLLTYLSITGAKWSREDRAAAQMAPYVDMAITAPVKIAADGTEKVTKAEAYKRVVAYLLATPEGSILVSDRKLAEIIGAKKSSLNVWLKKWAETGELLIAEKRRGQKLISLRKAA